MANIATRRMALRGPDENSLSAPQLQLDGLLRDISRPSAGGIASMAAAGLFGRALGTGLAALGTRAALAPFATRAIYHSASLFSEVAVYRGLTQGFPAIFERQGFSADLLNFGVLRAAGGLGQGMNPLAAQALQSGALVLAQNAAHRAGLAQESPQGSLISQFAHAQAFGLQQMAAMALLHRATGGRMILAERRLELERQVRLAPPSLNAPRGVEPIARMASPYPSFEVARQRIFHIFNQARAQRLEANREALSRETAPFRRRFLEEEAGRLDSCPARSVLELLEYVNSLQSLYMRNLMQGVKPAVEWRAGLLRDIMALQGELGAYDQFVLNGGEIPSFPPALVGLLPRLQRWARPAEAPLFVREVGASSSLRIDESVYVNLHRIHSYQDVVGEGKIERYRREVRELGGLKHPLQVAFHPQLGLIALSDGNHHATAALREGYDFAEARYKGRISVVQPAVPLRELRVVSDGELARLIQERDGGEGMTIASLEEMARDALFSHPEYNIRHPISSFRVGDRFLVAEESRTRLEARVERTPDQFNRTSHRLIYELNGKEVGEGIFQERPEARELVWLNLEIHPDWRGNNLGKVITLYHLQQAHRLGWRFTRDIITNQKLIRTAGRPFERGERMYLGDATVQKLVMTMDPWEPEMLPVGPVLPLYETDTSTWETNRYTAYRITGTPNPALFPR